MGTACTEGSSAFSRSDLARRCEFKGKSPADVVCDGRVGTVGCLDNDSHKHLESRGFHVTIPFSGFATLSERAVTVKRGRSAGPRWCFRTERGKRRNLRTECGDDQTSVNEYRATIPNRIVRVRIYARYSVAKIYFTTLLISISANCRPFVPSTASMHTVRPSRLRRGCVSTRHSPAYSFGK